MKKLVRSVGIISAAVAFGAGTALSAPLAGAQSSLPDSPALADNCGETVVTPSGLAAAGWTTPSDETPAAIAAVTGASPAVGPAALTFGAQATGKPGISLYKNTTALPLSDLLEDGEAIDLGYDYISSGQAPALQIRVEGATLDPSENTAGGFGIGFATILWSPENGNGEWKNADPADSNDFRVSRKLVGETGTIPRHTPMSLEDIVALNPDAKITAYGVQKTKENEATNVAIDNFTFGCEVTDFELVEPAAEAEGSLGNIFGSVSGIFQS